MPCSRARLRRLGEHMRPTAAPITASASEAVRAIVPYRRLSAHDPTRLVYRGEGDDRDPRPHEMLDLRAAETSLLRDGFAMLPQVSALDLAKLHQEPELYDDREHVREVTAARAAYRLEMEALARKAFERESEHVVFVVAGNGMFTRASRDIKAARGEPPKHGEPGSMMLPIPAVVHSDLGFGHGMVHNSGVPWQQDTPEFRRRLAEANVSFERLESCRHVIVQTWRPITDHPVQRDPLAVLDPRSLRAEDLFSTGLNRNDPMGDDHGGRNAGRFVVYNPAHRWALIPNQQREEVLLFAGYDSGRDMYTQPLFHTSVTVPPPPEAEAAGRISVDVIVHCWLEEPSSAAER